jgi:hypothetical protein
VDKPTAAILLTLVVHVLGIGVLFWLALDGERFDRRGWWPQDGGDGGDGGGGSPAPEPEGPRDGVPLPDAEPAAVRLRSGHERLTGTPRRERRPQHAPDPARPRQPA